MVVNCVSYGGEKRGEKQCYESGSQLFSGRARREKEGERQFAVSVKDPREGLYQADRGLATLTVHLSSCLWVKESEKMRCYVKTVTVQVTS